MGVKIVERRTFLELQCEHSEKMVDFSRRRSMSDTDIKYDLGVLAESCATSCGDDRSSKDDDTESVCSWSTSQESWAPAHQCSDVCPNTSDSVSAEQAQTCGYVWSAVPVFMFVPAVVPHHFPAEQQQDAMQIDREFDGSSEQEDPASTPAVSRRHRKRQKAKASKKPTASSMASTANVESSSHASLDVSTSVHTSAAVADTVDDSPPTTIIIRNLPKECTRDAMIQVLQSEGYGGSYDMVHVPVGFQDLTGLGHALVNFTDPAIAQAALLHFEGFSGLSASADLCQAGWSNVQGLLAHVKRYRDSPMMHESIPDRFKPAMFKDGVQVSFPEPTKQLKAPRIRHQKVHP
jgi:hypothetical protein